jgi:hypothetical protein
MTLTTATFGSVHEYILATPGRIQVVQKARRFSSRHGRSFDGRIETHTVETPDSQKMPSSIAISFFAIIAHDGDDSRQLWRYRLQGNPHGHGLPRRGHVFGSFGRLFTDGAAGIVGGEFFETVPMNGMSTGHFVRGVSGTEEIFLTYGAVGHVLAGLAIVIVKEEGIDTHPTVIAVTKVFSSPHSTKAAIATMVRRFVIGHPKIANVAMVGSKLGLTSTAKFAVVLDRI